jgi:hypothetical protein
MVNDVSGPAWESGAKDGGRRCAFPPYYRYEIRANMKSEKEGVDGTVKPCHDEEVDRATA